MLDISGIMGSDTFYLFDRPLFAQGAILLCKGWLLDGRAVGCRNLNSAPDYFQLLQDNLAQQF